MADLCDLFNAAGGWLRDRGWAGERRRVRGRDDDPMFDLFPATVAVLDLSQLPASWAEAFASSNWTLGDEEGAFDLYSLFDLASRLGFVIEPLAACTFLVESADAPSIPF